MKKTILLTLALFIFISIELDAKPDSGISFNFFYSSLSPYGEWIQLDNELVVWKPNGIQDNWRPYSDGRWNWTSEGWYWDSYEPFGWATYHYGRWFFDDYYGWIWIPDYEWAPAWVEWRYDNDYIGWAPLPPYAGFEINFGIHFSLGWHSHYNYWNFVAYNRFCDHRVHDYFLDNRRVSRIFENTRYRNNYYSDRGRIINGGIDRQYIERKAGYRIAERDINTVDNYKDYERVRSERGDRIYSYRPSDREVISDRSIDKLDIKKGDNRSSIEREKVKLPMARDWNRNENTEERNSGREIMTDRNTIRNDRGNIPEDNNFNNDRNQLRRRDSERDRSIERKREPVYVRPERRENPQSSERRIEPRKNYGSERPAPRFERSDRQQEKSATKERTSSRKR